LTRWNTGRQASHRPEPVEQPTCLLHDKGWQRVWRNGDPCSYNLGQYLNYSRPNRSTQARQLQARSSSKMNLPRKENR